MSFDINAKIRGDNSDLKGKLREIESSVDKVAQHARSALGGNFFGNLLSSSLQAAGLGAAMAMVDQFATKFRDKLKGIRLEAMRTEMDTQTVQRLQNLESKTEIGTGSIGANFERGAVAQSKAQEGDKALMRSFVLLGATYSDVMEKSWQDLSIQIFKNLQGLDMTIDKVKAIKDIYGKTGMEMMPAARMGLDSTAANTGLVPDKDMDQLRAQDKANAQTDKFWASVANWFSFHAVSFKNFVKNPWSLLPSAFRNEKDQLE